MTTTEDGTGADQRRPVVDLYARLSRCPTDGSLEKVETQLADCRAVAERNGWTVGKEVVAEKASMHSGWTWALPGPTVSEGSAKGAKSAKSAAPREALPSLPSRSLRPVPMPPEET